MLRANHDAVHEVDDAPAREARGRATRVGCGAARTRGRWEDLCCCPTSGAGAERRSRCDGSFRGAKRSAGALCLQVARRRIEKVCRACCGARARVSGAVFEWAAVRARRGGGRATAARVWEFACRRHDVRAHRRRRGPPSRGRLLASIGARGAWCCRIESVVPRRRLSSDIDDIQSR